MHPQDLHAVHHNDAPVPGGAGDARRNSQNAFRARCAQLTAAIDDDRQLRFNGGYNRGDRGRDPLMNG